MSLSKQKRATWTEDSLAAAVRAIRNGLSTYKASEQYGIPRRTLRNHVQKGNLVKRLGRHTIFTTDQEKDFVRRIIRFSDLGIPMTPKMIRIQAFAFCQKFDIPHSFNKESGIAGKGWLRLFLKRNPELAKRKAQFLNPARAQKLNKPIVSKHFQEVRKLYDELDLHDHPERIFNMDEKGCRLTLHHQQKVISQKGVKRVHMQVAEHGENVTVVGCANAFGNPIPPMVLFKGKRKKPEFDENLPPGAVVHMAAKGSITTELFVVFIQHLAKFKPFGKCLLIFDGAKSHLDFRIAEEAEKHDIVLYCLPSNTTHELQPMDKSCFKPFETYWDQEVLEFLYKNRATIENSKNLNQPQVLPPIYNLSPTTNQKNMVYDQISSEEDNIPLAQISTKSDFQKFMPTPDYGDIKTRPRRKALNYMGQRVTKDLFNRKDIEDKKKTKTMGSKKDTKAPRKPTNYKRTQTKKNKKAENEESWYCHACQKDEIADMRPCKDCFKWYHEDCIGITKDDSEAFVCPDCDKN